MSSSLMWKRVSDYAGTFSYEVKRALQSRYTNDSVIQDLVLNNDDIPYLEGLADGGVKSAEDVILAIRKHGSIILNEQF